MILPCRAAAALFGSLLMLAACDSPTPSAGQETPVPATQAPAAPAIAAPAVAVPAEPSRSRDPAAVLAAWAKAVEARDWALVRQYWGNHGEQSGMSAAEFSAQWSKLSAPVVQIGTGQQEGAAGSLYTTAPVTITDGKRTIRGEITLRRANDVPGATAEQLRWHIEATTLDLHRLANR